MILPLLLLGGGALALILLAASDNDRPVPEHPPDLPPAAATPGSTRWKGVNAILPELRKASESSGVPLGLMVGWIAKESGGRIGEVTPKYDERGYFQLMPAESKSLGLDHSRLSTDPVYSINAGLLLIAKYMRGADALNVAPKGSTYYWRLVKLGHTMGQGAVNKIVPAAYAAGQAGTWEALERYAVDRDREFLSSTKHSPKKWFPLVDAVYEVGAPFGFGSPTTVVGAAAFSDIPDPLDCIARK